MRDILTRLTFSFGERMSTNETNELYESVDKKSQAGWKLDVIKEFVTTHADESDVCNKAVELATLLGVDKYEKGTTAEEYWKNVKNSIKKGSKPEVKKAAKTVKSTASDYGCGPHYPDYGCGSSYSRRSYSSYGCGSSSSDYGC